MYVCKKESLKGEKGSVSIRHTFRARLQAESVQIDVQVEECRPS